MKRPAPEVGEIIRYAYLWRDEAERGQSEGLKNRPVVVVVARRMIAGVLRVVVVPITHTPPVSEDRSVALPLRTTRRLGLDGEPQWICVSDANAFVWPGPDLRPLPGKGPETIVIGRAPVKLMRVVRERLERNLVARVAKVTIRHE